MKNTILFFFLLLAAAVSAQSNSFVTDRLRAAEYFRIGTNTSQKVTGFDRVITAPGTHDSLPTSRAVVDFLEANFTPIGYYTAGTGISISDDVITNSAPDQVVGLTGAGITVITGTYPNFTITSNEVDGSTTNELQNLSLSGQSLSISSGTGVTLPVVGVTAGTGIGVSASSGNYTVSNTGDLSATNEIQTLSLDGSDLSLSLGGGTVTLPGAAISWPLLAPDGSDTAPSYSFENATASGLYKTSKGIELIGGGGSGISIRTQNETTESSKNISINTGSSEDGDTGSFLIFSGESINGTGGSFSLQAGGGGSQGGGFTLSAGSSSAGAGGEFSMVSGSSTVGDGGRLLMNAGNSEDSAGGDVLITPGFGATANGKLVCNGGDGFVFPSLSGAQISALVSPVAGQSVFCTDCTANDSTTGVLQVYNGLKWKNCW